MSDIVSDTSTKTDAEYIAEFEEIMAKIRRYEVIFDKLQVEIQEIRRNTDRRAAKNDVTFAAIDRQLEDIARIAALEREVEELKRRLTEQDEQ